MPLTRERNWESQLINRQVAAATADLNRNQRDYRQQQITTQTELHEAQAALELARWR